MRFKNLTITLTLTCLSVVALAGLVLLPITNGICEWTGDESNQSYYTNSIVENPGSEDTLRGRGWHLSASLNSSDSGASASVTPSIYGEKAFTTDTTYSGRAMVEAYREAGWGNVHFYCDTLEEFYERHPNYQYKMCGGHYETRWIEADTKQNTGEGKEQTIATKVVGIEHWVMHQVTRTESNGTSTTIGGTADIKVSDTVGLSIGANHTWTGANSLSYSGTVQEKRPKYREDESEGQSQSESVDSYETLKCGAYTAIIFYEVQERSSVVHNKYAIHIRDN